MTEKGQAEEVGIRESEVTHAAWTAFPGRRREGRREERRERKGEEGREGRGEKGRRKRGEEGEGEERTGEERREGEVEERRREECRSGCDTPTSSINNPLVQAG